MPTEAQPGGPGYTGPKRAAPRHSGSRQPESTADGRPDALYPIAIPLALQAQSWLNGLAYDTGSSRIAALCGTKLLSERAGIGGFSVPGMVSAGGGCRLYRAADGWVALNHARPDDLTLLPALFGDAALFGKSPDITFPAIAARMAHIASERLVEQGRDLGLAIARTGEAPPPAVATLAEGLPQMPPTVPPLVLDLSALWAGPLAAHLLWLAGARVIKIENPRRPDGMRSGDPAFFASLNQGKANVALDPAGTDGREALLALIARADIVIEAARPRALAQLGIDASALVRARIGKPLVWINITGHGALGEAANWVGFGDDCAVAGGLTDAMIGATGQAGFVGDAIADPLTGIHAAREGWTAWAAGQSRRIGVAMSGVVANALAAERAEAPARLFAGLVAWGKARGCPFRPFRSRPIIAPVAALGADTAHWLAQTRPC